MKLHRITGLMLVLLGGVLEVSAQTAPPPTPTTTPQQQRFTIQQILEMRDIMDAFPGPKNTIIRTPSALVSILRMATITGQLPANQDQNTGKTRPITGYL